MAKKKSGRGTAKKTTAKAKAPTIRVPIEQPTPEMQARVTFDLNDVKTEMGQILGRAYRRRPLYETMRAAGAISPDEVDALRFYRTAHDRCEYSPMKSCLNVEHGGGGFSAVAVAFTSSPSIVIARRNLRLCEATIGHGLNVMRAVALHDRSFSELAIDRHGSRENGGKVVPRSGRHRAEIRAEFHDALGRLTDTVRSLTTQACVEEVWIYPEDDGTATIRRGLVAPAGTYRCWGDSEKLDMIIADLRKKWGGRAGRG
jgi:hypothetical protein